ncbi:MAG: sterol desaturase family protein [Cyclobacteriaceae bacterium]|mgnify:CR=1 FL=1
MDSFIQFWETIPSSYRAGILVGGIAFFWIMESALPLFRFKYHKVKHAGINFFLTVTTIVINFLFAGLLLLVSRWVVANEFGILQWIELPLWAEIILGLMLLDLIGAYFIHWLEHQVKVMWQFHLVHHSDTTVDTTTANRHHPGESVFRAVFTTLAVFIAGAPLWLVFLYQSISVVLSQFNHANIHLPEKINQIVSWVFVTPNMHHVHHHYTQPLTDTNYGNIFSVWDRLFGTFAYVADPQTLVYGIDTHPKPKEHSHIGGVLKIPFQQYRPPNVPKVTKPRRVDLS